MLNINFSNRQRKLQLPPRTKELVFDAVKASLSVEGFTGSTEVNVTFVSDSKIREINREFRSIDSATDVLSFPLGENGDYDVNPENGCLMLGDVIISVEHALKQADIFGHSTEREIAYLTVHSIFHLLGYDHVDEGEDKKLMRECEEKALAIIGLQII